MPQIADLGVLSDTAASRAKCRSGNGRGFYACGGRSEKKQSAETSISAEASAEARKPQYGEAA